MARFHFRGSGFALTVWRPFFSLPQRGTELSSRITVMKFGGTSLEDGPGFVRVAQLLQANETDESPPPIAVVSAMSGVTDALMSSLVLAQEQGASTASRSLEQHYERHLEVARMFGRTAAATMTAHLENAREEIEELLEADASNYLVKRDAISAFGELLSAQLLTLVLSELGSPACYVDARRCIKTNGEHGNARPLSRETEFHTQAELQGLIEQKKLPVLGGFIGSTIRGATTTMGRGSSNHTATLVSAALNARETLIWTDVNGVHTADPSLVEQAQTIADLSYDEAEAMARLGAKVLHEGMFEPVRTQQIPIRILNSRSPEAEGTVIRAQSSYSKRPPAGRIKAIAHRNHLVRIDIRSKAGAFANGFHDSIERVFDRHRTSIEFIGKSAAGLSLVCDECAPLDVIVPDLGHIGEIEVTGRQALVGCVGEDLNRASNGAGAITDDLKKIDPGLEWQTMSELNVLTVVDCALVEPLVRRLHHQIFEK